MTLLIVGAHGQAGVELTRRARAAGLAVVTPSREALDVTDAARVRATIVRLQPRWVINFSAFHVLEACERDFAAALAVNTTAVRELALSAASAGARLLTVSTDYVFDGTKGAPYTEDDAPAPLQAYGVSKRAGELAALAAAPRWTYVVRTCGLYGRGGSRARGGNFVDKRLAEGRTSKQLEVGADLTCSPTSAAAFAAAVLELITTDEAGPGIYHLAAEGACSWAGFTEEAFRLAGLECKVQPVDRRGDYGIVRRPACSVLANRRAAALGISLPSWDDDLAAYLAETRGRP